MFLLHLLRWLRSHSTLDFDILLGAGGPLEHDFARVAAIKSASSLTSPDAFAGYDLIYSNTCCNGYLLDALPCQAVPIITHFHELDFGYETLGARRLGPVFQHTQRFIACAEAVAVGLRRHFNVPAPSIAVHYEMITPDVVASNADATPIAAMREQLGLAPDAQVIVACGTFDWRKAPDLFIQVAAAVRRRADPGRKVVFLWVGKFTDLQLASRLQYDLRHAGVGDDVRLIGEWENPHGVMAAADLYCLTSREDPFPLAMLEAASMGKPIVCFENSGGAAEFCALGGGYAVPYLDTNAMAEKCLELLGDDARRRSVGAAGAAAVQARFTPSAVAPGILREIECFRTQREAAGSPRPVRDSLLDAYARWPINQCPDREYVETFLHRAAVRRNAQIAVASGRKTEAVQILSRFVASISGTRRAAVVVESVFEIAEDLRVIDPARAQYLRGEAERIARAGGLPLDQFRPKPAAISSAGPTHAAPTPVAHKT